MNTDERRALHAYAEASLPAPKTTLHLRRVSEFTDEEFATIDALRAKGDDLAAQKAILRFMGVTP